MYEINAFLLEMAPEVVDFVDAANNKLFEGHFGRIGEG